MDYCVFSLAEPADIPEIVALYNSLVGTPGCTWSFDYPSRLTAELDIKNKWLYVLKKNGTIIAAASAGKFNELNDLHWAPKNPCELARIGVLPRMQNQGVGTILLKRIMETVKEKGYDGITMLVSKTNPVALTLYEKNGFEKCGEVLRFDIDFYCYQIELHPSK